MLKVKLIRKNLDLVQLLNAQKAIINLRENKDNVIVSQAFGHGCNLQDEWGGGIAAHYANKYPRLLKTSKETNKYLGGFSRCRITGSMYGYNLYTQTNGGSGSFSYQALYRSIYDMVEFEIKDAKHVVKQNSEKVYLHIALPMIGAGIAGGQPNCCLYYMQLAVYNAYADMMRLGQLPFDVEIFYVIWDDVAGKMGFNNFYIRPNPPEDPRLDPTSEFFMETFAGQPSNVFGYDIFENWYQYETVGLVEYPYSKNLS